MNEDYVYFDDEAWDEEYDNDYDYYDYNDDELEMGFDPYSGGYTYDC